MVRLLNRIPLTKKLAIILIVGFVIPMLTYSLVTTNRLYQQNIQERTLRVNQTLDHVCSELDMQLSDAFSLSLAFAADESLNRCLDTDYASYYDYLVTYQDVIEPAMSVSPVYRVVDWVRIYTDNPTVISGGNVFSVSDMNDSFDENPVTMDVLDIPGETVRLRLSTRKNLTRGELDVSLIRSMDNRLRDAKYHRVLRLSLNLSYLESALAQVDPFEEVLLMDPMNRVIVSSNSVFSVGSPLRTFDVDALEDGYDLITRPLASIPNLQLVGIYDRSILLNDFIQIGATYALLALALILLGVLLSTLLARTMTSRLKLIGEQAQRIAQEDFAQLDEAKMGSDEVGQLAADINRMSLQLQQHIDNEYAARIRHAKLQREKARAELNALQSQVNPHFMFNAMEAIRLKAKLRGENETARMISYMARMFRRLLDWREDLIPLGEELAFIHEFLAIQRYRYDNDFTFTVHADEQLMECCIPKMIIQPLVENACVHGLRSDTARRDAALNITRDGAWMVIRVEDHGDGVSEERLQELRQLLHDGDNAMHSVGLNNVQRRCRLYYGQAAQLDVDVPEAGGIVFSVRIPVYWRKEDFHVSDPDRR